MNLKISLLAMICSCNLGVTSVSCSECKLPENSQMEIIEETWLKGFVLKVDGEYIQGIPNRKAQTIVLEGVEHVKSVTDVNIELPEGVEVFPEPLTFLGKWKKEQTMTLTAVNGESIVYHVILPDLVDGVYETIFEDNFDTDGIPDKTRWTLCPRETSDWNEEMSESYDQAYVKDGNLILKGEKVNGEYRTGGVKTEGNFSFTYGKVEVRARIVHHPQGAFPAIWMMPEKSIYPGWPDCGEIDIMEHIKEKPYVYQTVHSRYTHKLTNMLKHKDQNKAVCEVDEYNVYGVEWLSDRLIFSVNGDETFTYHRMYLKNEDRQGQWPFTDAARFYLILNMGLGGNALKSWAGKIDDKNLPAEMQVDWVRVSQ